MIHVLICPHRLDYGGSQLSAHHWAKYLDKDKFKVSILAMKRGGLSSKFEQYYPVYYDDIGYPNIKQYLERLKPDILHACPPGGKPMDYITKAATLVPVTQTTMCPRPSANLDDVSGTVVPSRYVLSLQPPARNIVHIDHPFDPTDYSPKYSRSYFEIPKDKILAGSLGNNRRENAHFMKIARHYKNKDTYFVIKTGKKYRYIFGRNRITVINKYLSEDEKLSLIGCFDIFLYPTSNEAYGIVFLEAMSQKVPLISYNDSANLEVIREGGLLAPLNDIDKMKELLDDLVTNPEKRKAIGQAGYKLFMKRNNPKLIAKKYEAFFEEIIKIVLSNKT